jgi:hypothetical protein
LIMTTGWMSNPTLPSAPLRTFAESFVLVKNKSSYAITTDLLRYVDLNFETETAAAGTAHATTVMAETPLLTPMGATTVDVAVPAVVSLSPATDLHVNANSTSAVLSPRHPLPLPIGSGVKKSSPPAAPVTVAVSPSSTAVVRAPISIVEPTMDVPQTSVPVPVVPSAVNETPTQAASPDAATVPMDVSDTVDC